MPTDIETLVGDTGVDPGVYSDSYTDLYPAGAPQAARTELKGATG